MYSMGRDPRRIRANPGPVVAVAAVSMLDAVAGNVNAGEPPKTCWKGQESPTTH